MEELDPVDARMPVWSAMAELFLDTELQPGDHLRIAAVLAASDYSEAELEDIFRCEVSPALESNLRSVAGEWTGFDREWLRKTLGPRIGKRRPWLTLGGARRVTELWIHVMQQVRALRSAS
jgi:hypothetical protein